MNDELKNAYKVTHDAECGMVKDLAGVITDFAGKIQDMKAEVPKGGEQSAAYQFLSRIEQALNSVSTYDLNTVRSSYGIDVPAPAAVVTPVTV